MKQIRKIVTTAVMTLICTAAMGQNLAGFHVLINPGHGGFDSDDRNITIKPFKSLDPNGFWESQSNLDKGLQLKELLEKAGATVVMSRTTNNPTVYQRNEAGEIMKDKDGDDIIISTDDTPLSQIVRMANTAEVDYMLSIHTNAGVTNYVLQLYAGVDENDTHVYPSPTPWSDRGREISTLIANDQYSNQANTWASAPTVRGDKTFGRTAMGWSDGYGVLRGLTVPGCISEGSMHDYIPETYRLMNMEYKWLEAWHFLKSFSTYMGQQIQTGNIAGTIHDSRNVNLEEYYRIKNSKDNLRPIHRAKVTLMPGNKIYTTDDLYNGVFVFKELAPGSYTVTIEAEGYYTQTETLEVVKHQTTYFNAMLNKVRSTPPAVVSHSPNVEPGVPVECSTPVVLTFNWDMDVASTTQAFSIEPKVEGVITFEDSQHRLIFTPTIPYEINTVYTVRLAASAKHPGDIAMGADFSFQFMTKDRNRLVMFMSNPMANSTIHYESPIFEFRFDNKLYTINLKDAINVYDTQGTILPKNTRSVKHNKLADPYGSTSFQLQENLVPGKEYKLVLASDVKDVNNINIVTPIEFTFKAIDVKVSDKPIIVDFETAGMLRFDPESSQETVSCSILRNTSTKLFGAASYAFKYSFTTASQASALCELVTPIGAIKNSRVVGAHIYGDLSTNELFLVFKHDQDKHYIKLADLNFLGWQFVEVALSALPVGKEYELVGFKLVKKEAEVSNIGELYMDNMLLYDQLLNSNITPSYTKVAQVYPNPVSDVVYTTLPAEDATLELYSSSGVLIKQVKSNMMGVSMLEAGVYFMRLISSELIETHPIIIKHD